MITLKVNQSIKNSMSAVVLFSVLVCACVLFIEFIQILTSLSNCDDHLTSCGEGIRQIKLQVILSGIRIRLNGKISIDFQFAIQGQVGRLQTPSTDKPALHSPIALSSQSSSHSLCAYVCVLVSGLVCVCKCVCLCESVYVCVCA